MPPFSYITSSCVNELVVHQSFSTTTIHFPNYYRFLSLDFWQTMFLLIKKKNLGYFWSCILPNELQDQFIKSYESFFEILTEIPWVGDYAQIVYLEYDPNLREQMSSHSQELPFHTQMTISVGLQILQLSQQPATEPTVRHLQSLLVSFLNQLPYLPLLG